jgi:hypothetical protein
MRSAPTEGRRAVEKQGGQEHALSSTPCRATQLISELEAMADWRDELEARLVRARLKVEAGAPDDSFTELEAEIGEWVHVSKALALAMIQWRRE